MTLTVHKLDDTTQESCFSPRKSAAEADFANTPVLLSPLLKPARPLSFFEALPPFPVQTVEPLYMAIEPVEPSEPVSTAIDSHAFVMSPACGNTSAEPSTEFAWNAKSIAELVQERKDCEARISTKRGSARLRRLFTRREH